MAFERWAGRITSATDEGSQRALLAEIGQWRAANLTDIPGLREAAFAVSRLYGLLGDHDASVREARSLISLCQTAPVATGEERQSARAYLASLGEKVPKMQLASSRRQDRGRRDTPRKAERPATDHSQIAIERTLAGDHGGALKILKGRKGRAELLRAWVRLDRALKSDDRDAQLASLDRWFRQVLQVPATEAPVESRRAPVEPPTEEDGPLAGLLGRKLPRRREARVRMMERWLQEHPSRADELAATALDWHLADAGKDIPAPWLAPFVARARLAGSAGTDAAVARLVEAGSVAVQIYEEWAFGRAVAFASTAPERFAGLRRGLLGRGAEPDDRRGWTLKLDGGERMLVLVPPNDEAYPAEAADAVAARLPHICGRAVVLAPGAGNAPLREAVARAGFVTLGGEPSDAELQSALENAKEVAPPARPPKARPERPAAAQPAPEPEAPVPAGPPPLEVLSETLFGGEVPGVAALQEPLGSLKKVRDIFLEAERRWKPFPDDASARLAALLTAADATAPQSLNVPEATTLSLRVAAAQGGPTLAALTEGSTATRFGGPGAADVVDVVRAARDAGWDVHRAFRGTTRRERRNNAALAALADSVGGVWRLAIEKDGGRKELWYVAELPVEGRAAIPQLLLEERERVVLLPIDPELTAWWGTLGGPDAIGWTPEDASVLAEALA